jgi:hypothetical protein
MEKSSALTGAVFRFSTDFQQIQGKAGEFNT